MIEITKSVFIENKSPEQLFNFFLSLNKDKYVKAAPNSHKDFKTIKPIQSIVGSVYYFHEKVGRLDLKHTWLVTDVRKYEYIFQKAQIFYPVTIEIYLEKVLGGTKLTQKILVGFIFFGFERIIDWFTKLFILTPWQIKTLHQHTQEEFTNWGKLS